MGCEICVSLVCLFHFVIIFDAIMCVFGHNMFVHVGLMNSIDLVFCQMF